MRSHGTRARTPRAYATSRRGGLTTASAALVCLGLLTAGCGGGGDDGYVAVDAAEQSQRDGDHDSSGPERPDDKVKMVPLPDAADGTAGSGGDHRGGSGAASKGGTGVGPEGKSADGGSGDGGGGSGDGASAGRAEADGSGGDGGSTGGSPSPGSPSPGGSTGGGGSSPTPGGGSGGSGNGGQGGGATPSGPAVLKVGAPQRAKAGDRWCEKVTVQFRNTGGSSVEKGTVTFSTHIIGSLGVDWDTRTSTRDLPVPLGAGEKKEKTWTVCVDSWRVPMGMHVETRDARVSGWK